MSGKCIIIILSHIYLIQMYVAGNCVSIEAIISHKELLMAFTYVSNTRERHKCKGSPNNCEVLII